MQTYLVGGAVRDELLGFTVQDKDYVVVGSTPEEMLAAGFKPVGKDFPVFLHPKTHDEYALARTERKTAKGYKGFAVHASPEVTLEEDLARRDLTINAIAKDSSGHYIDPYHGLADIQSKTLRHVSVAFAEDPVRILRAARFAARLTEFNVAAETIALMQQMTAAGEVDALVAERVWQELAKGLMEAQPSRMFAVLRACGALQKIIPELDCLWGVSQNIQHHSEVDAGAHVMLVIDYAAKRNFSLAVRFAALLHDLGKTVTPIDLLAQNMGHEEPDVSLVKEVCRRLKVPNDCRELAQIVAKFHVKLHQSLKMNASNLLNFLIEIDAIRQPDRFRDFLYACECYTLSNTNIKNTALTTADLIWQVLNVVQSVNAGEVASAYTEAEKIKAAVYAARLEAIKHALGKTE